MISPNEAYREAGTQVYVKLYSRYLGWMGAWFGTDALYRVGDKHRDKVPEPFDVPDHLGNAGYSILAGGAGAFVGFAGYLIGCAFSGRLERTPGNLRRAAAVTGAVAGLVLNVLVKTRTGQNFMNTFENSTTSALDVVYGGVAGVAGAACIASMIGEKELPQPPVSAPEYSQQSHEAAG